MGRVYLYPGRDGELTAEPAPTKSSIIYYQLSGGVGRVYLYPGRDGELTAEPAPTKSFIIYCQLSIIL
ncbi:hypothetical protein [Limnospira platensis]|uniref:hypothetical protein n=1 Tax=Limnospira platensis TaxID=118562 RepID=UPI0001D0EA6D|nr:hypothetical protein [Arthrospira platensis]AMW30185.1 hypothetical protein AP285_21880 [Arthrospira platensis YZ]KDR54137.1 hypothetical protein APPUASWS_031860 [Arthrospira platensis str. Paraca]MDF2207916.1 hypothetical protein [Arthrospira platensis NCB002]QQW28148.1 hypothetical protein AP9108_24155 [Arthrospira sp. PCC 9108]BAI92823.1 hypothetical protein NIES39_L06660 [Arthrospira platensis NIES-39]